MPALGSHACIVTMKEKQTIDNYRLTSMEEPTDEVLSALMKEAAEDARMKGTAAREKYFGQLREYAAQQYNSWFANNPRPTFAQ